MNLNQAFSCLLTIILTVSLSYLNGQSIDYTPGQILIKFKDGKSRTQRSNLRNQMQGTVLKSFPQLGIELWELRHARTKTDIPLYIRQYKNHPDIDFIEPDYIVSTEATIPNDPSFSTLWGQNNTGANGGTLDADIDAVEAWDINTESPDVVVAIIDSGIDWAHEDLVDNIWNNLGEDADGDGTVLEWNGSTWIFDPGDVNNIDDDGNGYADDFVGWDFRNNDNNPFDDRYHGTHVAGTVGASGNNNIGVVGVTWKVQLAALKFLSDNGKGKTSDAVAALNYAVTMGIPISNNSWGGGQYSSSLYQSLLNAEENGHLFFASAGNNGRNNDVNPRFPSSYNTDNIIAVASTTRNDVLSSFSNFGPSSVDISAPGSSIFSCYPLNEYSTLSGTSMATPQVAGSCALIWAQHPTKTASQIKEALLNSVDNIPDLSGKCVSEGRLNVYEAITYFSTPSTCRFIDSLALVDLYLATGGTNWSTSWDLNQPIDTWYGINLNADGCVQCIDLDGISNCSEDPTASGNSLVGSLPPSIEDLSFLTHLILSNNQLSGNLPEQLGNLNNLTTLCLSSNEFSGRLPSALEKLINLKTLSLNDNELVGQLPIGYSQLNNLETLYLFNNQLSGCYDPGLLTLCDQLITNMNTDISDGNEFDSPWEDFCASGSGECSGCRYTDSLTLVNLYQETNGANWASSWNLNEAMDFWHGVTLDVNGCVTKLILNSNSLSGSIPTDLGNLTMLTELNLSVNNLAGTIPSSLGNLRKLENLNLFKSQVVGNIPSELGNLIELTNLHMGFNLLTGSIPSSFGQLINLTHLNLYYNRLTGQIPPELGNLTELYSLNLSSNKISGSIPEELFNLIALRDLNLFSNLLTGGIAPSISNLKNIQLLKLTSNPLGGIIPSEIGQLTLLKDLNLSGNLLTGSIPPELGNLTNLTSLSLYNNQLSGSIPHEFGNLDKLRRLGLETNQLSGDIPASLGDLAELRYLGLSYNSLSGSIPPSFTVLTELTSLGLQENQLSGCYDSGLSTLCEFKNNHVSLGNNFDAPWEDFCNSGQGQCITGAGCAFNDSLALVALYNSTLGASWLNTWDLSLPMTSWHGVTLDSERCVVELDLSDNQLNGTIPANLGDLNKLVVLNLTDNLLGGTIPSELGQLSNLKTLELYRNQLSGSIPLEIGNLVSLTKLHLAFNLLSGEIPSTLGNLNLLEYIYLHRNQLTGRIPPQLVNSTNLLSMNLGQNQLNGDIPVELANSNSLSFLYLKDNQLSGCYDEDLIGLCNHLSQSSNSNSRISDGNNFDAPWEDFCGTNAGVCNSTFPVWPGDFNQDGKADNTDLLYWGLAESNTGSIRPNASTSWAGQTGPEWTTTINGINGKHQDADGNGIVNSLDLQVLIDNYDQISLIDNTRNSASSVEFRLAVISHTVTSAITTLEYALYAEKDNSPAEIHGAACEIVFEDFNFINAHIDISTSSLEPEEHLVISNGNTIDIALTRIDLDDKICAAPIASIIVQVATSDLSNADYFSVSVSRGQMATADGTISTSSSTSLYDVYATSNPSSNNMLLNGYAEHIQCLSAGSAEALISGGTGAYNIQWNTGARTSKISGLSPGIYTVTVSDANGLTKTMSLEIEGQYLPVYDDFGNLIMCNEFACPTVLDFIGNLPDGTHHASEAINTDAVVTSGFNPQLKAGNIIHLLPGFTVQDGSTFSVEIEVCEN